MRADRLVSLVMLLRQRGRLSAAVIAQELGVTPRTVLRDVEALSAAGVPVYAERGRRGGFELLPGFQAELAGLNQEETLALLVATSGRGQVFGLGSALSSAVRKIVDALPEGRRVVLDDAARRLLVDPEDDMVVHRRPSVVADRSATTKVRRAVLSGHKLRIHYAARNQEAQWRTVDPIGLVTVRGREYLVALRSGAERTYRLSRVVAAQELDELADRPEQVDMDRLWRESCARFLNDDDRRVVAHVEVTGSRQEELVSSALAVCVEESESDGRLRLEVTWQDAEHAEFALWQLAGDACALGPHWLRDRMRTRAVMITSHYGSLPQGDAVAHH